MYQFLTLTTLVGVSAALAITIYALFAPPPGEPQPVRPALWKLLLCGSVVAAAVWPWNYGLLTLGGWILIWGDNNHPLQNYIVPMACVLSGLVALAAMVRAALGIVPSRYLTTLLAMSAASLVAIAVLGVTSYESWTTVLTFSPIAIALASWTGVYRRQLRERKLSLASIFALITVLSVGLALTIYLRS